MGTDHQLQIVALAESLGVVRTPDVSSSACVRTAPGHVAGIGPQGIHQRIHSCITLQAPWVDGSLSCLGVTAVSGLYRASGVCRVQGSG